MKNGLVKVQQTDAALKEEINALSPMMLFEHFTKLATRFELASLKSIGEDRSIYSFHAERFQSLADKVLEEQLEIKEA